MDPRKYFFQTLISDSSKRILEIGPLNRPIADKRNYPNTFYCDIRSTEEVRKLYSGNAYLEATGITVNPETIIPIDYVVKESYKDTFKETEKFDYVIASHVMEHMEDIISSFLDISTVLKPGGVFYIVYPDKRYCFDHFRTSASFRDAYNVFVNGPAENASMVLDFYYSVIPENSPEVFWRKDDILTFLPTADFKYALEKYKQVREGGGGIDDVHYWPFSDMEFLKFLYDCIRARLLPFHCIAFYPCQENDQQFIIALQYEPKIQLHPEQALNELVKYMKNAIPDYFSSQDINRRNELDGLKSLINEQKLLIDEQNYIIELQEKAVELLEKRIKKQQETINNANNNANN